MAAHHRSAHPAPRVAIAPAPWPCQRLAGLLCVALLRLVAAENVTLCWGKTLRQEGPVCHRCDGCSSAQCGVHCAGLDCKEGHLTCRSGPCAGLGSDGQLGNGMLRFSTDYESKVPVVVMGNHSFKFVCTAFSHSCALEQSGKAWCWGEWWHGVSGCSFTAVGQLQLPHHSLLAYIVQGMAAAASLGPMAPPAPLCQWRCWAAIPSMPSPAGECTRVPWMLRARLGVGVRLLALFVAPSSVRWT